MRELTVSSKGQIVLPADLRRRHGMGAGAKLEVVETADGLTLRVLRFVENADVAAYAGMIKARPSGQPRNLMDFDPASTLAVKPRG